MTGDIYSREMKEEVDSLLLLDESEIYARLGLLSVGERTKASSIVIGERLVLERGDLIKEGQKFFQSQLDNLRILICEKCSYCKKMDEYNTNFDLLVRAALPATGMIFGMIPQAVVILLIVLAFKYGLARLCGCP